MTATERLQAVLDRVNTATNNIATDLRNLKDIIGAGGPTEDVMAGLEKAATALEGVAASTEDLPEGGGQ